MMLFILTGKSFDEAIVPTIIVNCVWMFSYYLYERIWTHIDWGKEKNDSKKPFVYLEKNVVLNPKRKNNMFTVKSLLKFFPITVGDYSLTYNEKANEYVLREKGHAWMGYDQNTYWQSTELYIEINKASGVCITTGLGLGIKEAHLCLKNNVSKVIVYEKSKDVIEIFHRLVDYNNFDISKIEIRNEDADNFSGQVCDCLFPDHFDSESESHIINIVKNLSYNNTAEMVWYWPAGHHFIKYANKLNKPYNTDTYELWKKHTGIKNLPNLSDEIYLYITELQRVYSQDVRGKLHEDIMTSIMRKNMLNQSKKLR